ncbi:MAG: polymer-forming cytoskeletal protein [Dehalococcoidia bacterium]
MKLGNNRREYGKLSSDWQKQTMTESVPEREELDTEFEPEPSYLAPATEFRATGPSDDFASVIGAESSWQGNFSTEGSVRVEGTVSGEIRAAGTVFISNGAEVKATVYGHFVIIAGSFDGKLYCTERLELQPSSKIKGAIHTKALSVGEGAFIDGEIHMGDVKDFAAIEPVSAAVPSRNGDKEKSAARASGTGDS